LKPSLIGSKKPDPDTGDQLITDPPDSDSHYWKKAILLKSNNQSPKRMERRERQVVSVIS
jgi:hypothetical protein